MGSPFSETSVSCLEIVSCQEIASWGTQQDYHKTHWRKKGGIDMSAPQRTVNSGDRAHKRNLKADRSHVSPAIFPFSWVQSDGPGVHSCSDWLNRSDDTPARGLWPLTVLVQLQRHWLIEQLQDWISSW